MASTYSSDLKLELMATGENAGTWGDNTNNNLNLIQQAIAGFEQVTLSSGGTLALVMTDKQISNARNMVIKFASATIAASTICTIPDSIEKFYIFDATGLTNPSNLTIKTASGSGFTLDAAKIYAAYSDGTNLNEVSLDTLGGTIGTAQVADDAITYAKLQDTTTANRVLGAVSAGTIGEVQVQTAMIADDAVTTAKIADDAVGADQLANTAVTAGAYTVTSLTVDAQGRITAASSGTAGGGSEYLTFAADANTTNTHSGNFSITSGKVAGVYLWGGDGGKGGASTNAGGGGSGGRGAFGFWNVPTSVTSAPYSLGTVGNTGANGHGNYKGGAGGAGNATTVDVGPGTLSAGGGNGGSAPPNWNSSGGPGSQGNTSPSGDYNNWAFPSFMRGYGGTGNASSPSTSQQDGCMVIYTNEGA